MRTKKMVNDIPMSLVYTGMSVDRMHKLNILLDKAWDTVLTQQADKGDYMTPFDMLEPRVDQEFRRLLNRAAKKSEWNNKKHNKVATIIKSINKKKVSK